ncbi:MAG: STN protein, partial [Deltaproteobacteria bacterium]|nr:STN protein [Deltaproteobacteria bacterium]
EIKKAGKFTRADIITDGEISDYNVFDLKSPARVVVDVRNAREITAKREIKAVSPHIKGARLGRHDGQVRVVFDYKGSVKPYEVVKENDRITILFGKTPTTVEAKVEKAEPPAEKVQEPKKEERAEAPTKALKIKAVEIKKAGKFTRAEIITDGELSIYKVYDLKSPDRVIVDIENAKDISAKKNIKAVSHHIKGARIGRHDGRVRVVFDYKGSIEPYMVLKGDDRISILFGKESATGVEKVEKAEAKEAAPKIEEKVEVGVEEKAVAPIAGAETAAVQTKPEITEEVKTEIIAETPKEEAKVDQASAKPAEVVAEVKPAVEKVEVREEEKTDAKEKVVAAPVVAAAVEEKTEPEPEKKTASEGASEEMAKIYNGQKVTLEFKDADIKNIFRIIAEVSGYNMIIDSAVVGKVTIRLVNVPWDQALDILLETNNLGMKKVGNVIRVLPAALVKKEEEDKLASQKAKEKQEDLVSKLIPVSYAKASDISGRIKGVMTDRGTSEVDERTNTIILKDIQKSVDAAVKLVASLDTPTPQVIIEARIVTASTRFSKDLGVQWGAGYAADAAHGNPTGYYFPNSYNVSGGGGGSFALNPPASGGVGGAGGVVGINFGSINNTLNLDLRLSALETQGWGKVISSPKIITLDNKEASIQQGVSIPFETTSASGTQTQFVDASLNLTVTPHVTGDGRLSM